MADYVTPLDGGRLKVSLADGLTIGSVTYTAMILAPLTAGGIFAAQEESERVVLHQGQPILLPSNARMGREILRRQIARLETDTGETHQGPLALAELGKLSNPDLIRVQAGCDVLDRAMTSAATSGKALAERGRDDAGGGAAAAGDAGTGQTGGA